MGWKLASVINGAPDKLLESYEEERRPIAQDMLGLTTRLLTALKERGDMHRGREGQQLDLGYSGSSLGLNAPDRDQSLPAAGGRAPDAPMVGRAGQPVRAFELFKGPHWTLLAFNADESASFAVRKGLHIHRIGKGGDVADEDRAFQTAYGLEAGDWVLVRPDGYVGAIVGPGHLARLEEYLRSVGLER